MGSSMASMSGGVTRIGMGRVSVASAQKPGLKVRHILHDCVFYDKQSEGTHGDICRIRLSVTEFKPTARRVDPFRDLVDIL